MPKPKDESTILPEPEKIVKVEEKTANTLILENYPALQYITWLASDSLNIQNWGTQLFRGGFDKGDQKVSSLKDAVNSAIKETLDDIEQIKIFLQDY